VKIVYSGGADFKTGDAENTIYSGWMEFYYSCLGCVPAHLFYLFQKGITCSGTGQLIPGNVPAHPIGQSYNERAMEMSRAVYWNTVHQV